MQFAAQHFMHQQFSLRKCTSNHIDDLPRVDETGPLQHWNCFKGNIDETTERQNLLWRERIHMFFTSNNCKSTKSIANLPTQRRYHKGEKSVPSIVKSSNFFHHNFKNQSYLSFTVYTIEQFDTLCTNQVFLTTKFQT